MAETKKEKRFSTNRIILPLLFIANSIILEIANFLYLGLKTSDGSQMVLPTYFLLDFSIILMLAAVIFVMQNKHAICVCFSLLLFFQAGICIVNTTLFGLFGEILSVSLLKLGAEAATAFSFQLLDWGGVFLNLGLYVGMLIIAILLIKYNRSSFQIKHFAAPIIAFAMFFFAESISTCLFEIQVSSLATAESNESEISSSDVYLWDNFQFKMDAYKKFGYYGFYSKEIYNAIFYPVVEDYERKVYVDFIDDGYVPEDNTAPLYGDNLIVILLESIDLFAIDPVYTPTLYKMYQGWNSVTLQNFRARNRTNNSEGITILGSMPKNSTILDAYYSGYNFDYSLPKLFKRAGGDAVTNYVHRNYEAFYDRNITHGKKGIGFDDLITHEDYTGEQKLGNFSDWPLDEDFLRNVVDKILPTDQRFLTYFTTLSTHGEYNFYKHYFKDYYEEYDEKIEDYKLWLTENGFVYPEDSYNQSLLRTFKAATIDLENSINYLLDELENRGLAENTSIFMFADHNAYYHDLTYTIKGVSKSDFSSTYANHIPAIFYSPKLVGEEGKIIDTFTNTYDILPTICDVYGLEYNTNLFLGYSVLSDEIENSFFASHLGGMFTENIYSQNIKDVYILSDSVTEDEIKKFQENAVNYFYKQSILEKIYRNGINGKRKM